jgi:hypothetical protein
MTATDPRFFRACLITLSMTLILTFAVNAHLHKHPSAAGHVTRPTSGVVDIECTINDRHAVVCTTSRGTFVESGTKTATATNLGNGAHQLTLSTLQGAKDGTRINIATIR